VRTVPTVPNRSVDLKQSGAAGPHFLHRATAPAALPPAFGRLDRLTAAPPGPVGAVLISAGDGIRAIPGSVRPPGSARPMPTRLPIVRTVGSPSSGGQQHFWPAGRAVGPCPLQAAGRARSAIDRITSRCV
jgi:hypothetical protein